jgi:hypothetical protein
LTIFDPFGLSAIGCGILLAGYIFARIEHRNVHVSDPNASSRLPSHVDVDRLLFMVFGTEWVLLAIFVFADRLPGDLQRFVRLGCVSMALAMLLFHVLCVTRLRRLGVFHPRDENYRPGGQKRARHRPPRRAPN